MKGLCEGELGADLTLWRGPMLVAVGAEDRVVAPAGCAEVANELGCTLSLIPGAGHASPVEAPAVCAELVERMEAAGSGSKRFTESTATS